MNWTEGPATWKQLRYLNQLGYKPDHPLTKTEASDLIRSHGGQPETVTYTATAIPQADTGQAPHHFHNAVEEARQQFTEAKGDEAQKYRRHLEIAMTRRQEFWMDTCREISQMQIGSRAVVDLYRKHGCLYYLPSAHQVQEILNALDGAAPFWDRDHPQLFYQTMSLNFPGLLRHH